MEHGFSDSGPGAPMPSHDPDGEPPPPKVRCAAYPQLGPMVNLDDVIEVLVTEGAVAGLNALFNARQEIAARWDEIPLGHLIDINIERR
jgi:hypothetical protein